MHTEIDQLIASLMGQSKAASAPEPAAVPQPPQTASVGAADELRKLAQALATPQTATVAPEELYKMAATMHAADNAALAAEAEVMGAAMFDGFLKRSNAWAADQSAVTQQEQAVAQHAAHLQKVASAAAAYTQQLVAPPQPAAPTEAQIHKFAQDAEQLLLHSYNAGYEGASQVFGG